MIKLSTLILDRRIISKIRKGYAPKDIADQFHVTPWRVYDAVHRQKRGPKNSQKFPNFPNPLKPILL